MKKIFVYILMLVVLCGCSQQNIDSDKLNVVTTNFVYYDFAKNVVGEKAQVTMLVKPSADIHSFEPSPEDIITASGSDLFIYTGGENDAWAQTVIENANIKNTVKMLDYVKVTKENDHEGDEHIWTSPANAVKIVEAVLEQLCRIDAENGEYYAKNAESYINELILLDKEFMQTAENAERKILVFGDRFPFKHLTDRYNLSYYSAFAGCAHESEPDAKTVAELSDKVKNENIPVVFYTEMSNDKMARTIAENTGAKVLRLHSCHNVNTEEFESSESYISLMRNNLENIREALN